jgi:hypothetical protein
MYQNGKTCTYTRNTQEQGQDLADDYGRISNHGEDAEIVDTIVKKKQKKRSKLLKLDRNTQICKEEYSKWLVDPDHRKQLCREPNKLQGKGKTKTIEQALSLPLLGGKGKTLTELYR